MVFYHLDLFLTSSQEEHLKGCRVTVCAKQGTCNLQGSIGNSSIWGGDVLVSQFGDMFRGKHRMLTNAQLLLDFGLYERWSQRRGHKATSRYH